MEWWRLKFRLHGTKDLALHLREREIRYKSTREILPGADRNYCSGTP